MADVGIEVIVLELFMRKRQGLDFLILALNYNCFH